MRDWMIPLMVAVPAVLAPLLTFWLAGRAQDKIRSARHWPVARARILSSRVQKSSKGGRWAVVRYAYEVRGVKHESSRLSFVQTTVSSAKAEAILARYPSGAEIEARYDPQKPAYAVLEPDGDVLALRMSGVWLGGLFLIVAVILFVARS